MKRVPAFVQSSTLHRQSPAELQLVQRILLYPNELYRLPAGYRHVRAQQGIAHISHGRQDFIVLPGESLPLRHSRDFALISSLRNATLVLELFVEKRW